MEEVSQNKIDDLIENGYALRVTDYIKGGYQMVKNNLGLFVGFTVLLFAITSFAGMIPFGALAVSAPLSAGFFLAANKINKGYELEFTDFFKGFDSFAQLVGYSILVVLLFMALAIPVGLLALTMIALDFDEVPAVLLGGVFGLGILAVVIYFAVSFIWAPHLIVFAKKKAWEAMEISHKIIKKDFLNFAGFGLMLGLINFAGLMFFGLGLLFTIPVSACALYLAFEDVTDMRLENSEGYIENHLVD